MLVASSLVVLCLCPLALTVASAADQVGALDSRLPGFIKAKEQQARELAKTLDIKVSDDVWKAFDLFQQGKWLQASNHFARLMKRSGQYEGSKADATVGTPVWQPLLEVDLVCEQFAAGEPAYARAIGDDIISNIPPGSIYFGGTDPGRGLVTGLMRSQIQADPFFVITQNALADNNYLRYLREMYGKKLDIPSEDDSAKAFQEYLADAQRRLQKNQLKPGEDVRIIDNRVQVSGQVAVMTINGLLARVIFDRNREREVYIEESFPLDWMYPHLVPHGLILKVERDPVKVLSEEVVRRDQQYWARTCEGLVGGWLGAETTVRDIGKFADRVYRQNDLSGFRGDPKFARSDMTRKTFSKLRSAQGGVYQWRLQAASTAAERERMLRAADLAFRQAFALCPYSPEAVFRYVNLLLASNRSNDALQVAYTCLKFEPNNPQVTDLVKRLEEHRRQQKTIPEKVETPVDDPEEAAVEGGKKLRTSLELANDYLKKGRKDEAREILEKLVRAPDVDAVTLLQVAQVYAQVTDLAGLESTLERLVVVSPNSPEAWFDLAAVRVTADKDAQATSALRKALQLSVDRRKQDPNARDLIAEVRKDPRFQQLKETPEYREIVPAEKPR